MNLHQEAEKINKVLCARRLEIKLSFIEENHLYYMQDAHGELRSDFPSVSGVVKTFFEEFDSEKMSLLKAKGDKQEQVRLLKEWKEKAQFASNLGNRVHYFLEQHLVDQYNSFKKVREPIFCCNKEQEERSFKMIHAGKKFVDLMHSRGAVLLDTELILGDSMLGFVGQPDKVWLVANKEGSDYGFLITDWKTNSPQNFKNQTYTKKMYSPFDNLDSTALGHYSIQLPLYGRLLTKMLEGSIFASKRLFGSIIVLLRDDETFEEFRVSKDIIKKIYNLDFTKILNE
jgi:hypothetical protein